MSKTALQVQLSRLQMTRSMKETKTIREMIWGTWDKTIAEIIADNDETDKELNERMYA